MEHKTRTPPHSHLTTETSTNFSFLCFKHSSERRARAAGNTQEPHSDLATSISGISAAEPKKTHSSKHLAPAVCKHSPGTRELVFSTGSPSLHTGFSGAISHPQHQHGVTPNQISQKSNVQGGNSLPASLCNAYSMQLIKFID